MGVNMSTGTTGASSMQGAAPKHAAEHGANQPPLPPAAVDPCYYWPAHHCHGRALPVVPRLDHGQRLLGLM